jgi:hypothetical protein
MMRLVVAALLAVVLAPSVAAAQEADVEAPAARQAIEAVLDLDSGRGVPRLPRVTIDPTSGDLTVIFAMMRPGDDDPVHVAGVARADTWSILRAAYSSDDAWRIQTVTVLGTYRVVGKYERGKEIPLLRATLSSARAASLGWRATEADLDAFWMPDFTNLNAVGSPAR